MTRGVLHLSVGIAAALMAFSLRAQAQSAPAYYDPPNILRFADSLYEEGDFLRAAIEYRRYLSVASLTTREMDHVLLRIGFCYRSGGRPDTALAYFQKLIRESPFCALRPDAIIQCGLTWFSLERYDKAESFLTPINFQLEDAFYRQQQNVLIGASLLMQSRWTEALAHFGSSPSESPSPLETALKSLSVKGTKLVKKSPLLGGALSSVVPGLGRVYAKRTLDGLYSFITIGLAGWQAYEGFHKDGISSFKGWVFGVLGSAFYIGNIYGSAVAVKIYNRRAGDNIHTEVRLLINASF